MKKLIIAGIVFVVILIGVSSFTFVVDETELAIVTQFGAPIGQPITTPGLHFKTPFVQEVRFFDSRILEWNGETKEVPTKDKRFILVDSYARWRIVDPLRFYQRLRDERGAQLRLDDIIDGATRNYVANHDLIELVRTSNRSMPEEELDYIDPDAAAELLNISVGRSRITEMILAAVQERTSDLGIEVIDVRLKRIDYNEEVRRSVYERMVAERQRIAQRYKSEGAGDAARIRGEKELELNTVRSQARRTAEEIRGNADAEAIRIYAEAFNLDPEFYQFLRSMESYPQAVDQNTTLMLSTDMEFFRYLKNRDGR